MKILYCIPGLHISGGLERILTEKINYLHEVYGYDITILTNESGYDNNGELLPPFYPLLKGVKVVNLSLNINQYAGYPLIKKIYYQYKLTKIYREKLQQYCDSEKPDIVVSVGGRELFWLMEINGCFARVAELHLAQNNMQLRFKALYGNKLFWNILGRIQTRRLINSTKYLDKLVVLTKSQKKIWDETNDNVEQIYNFTLIQPSGQNNRESKNLISVGRLDVQKGYDILIPLFRKVVDKHPDWSLDIYGEGEWHDKLEQMIVENRLQNNVYLKGTSNNIKREYENHYAFVLSSRFEGFSLVLSEAMACAIPCISFDCPSGPAELIRDGETGYLIPLGNADLMADKIIELIENKELATQIGEAAAKDIRKLNKDNIMKQWNELFVSLAEQK